MRKRISVIRNNFLLSKAVNNNVFVWNLVAISNKFIVS